MPVGSSVGEDVELVWEGKHRKKIFFRFVGNCLNNPSATLLIPPPYATRIYTKMFRSEIGGYL